MNNKILLTIAVIAIIFIAGCAANENENHSEHDHEGDHQNSDIVSLHLKSIKEVGIQISSVAKTPLSGSLSIPARIIANQDLEAQVGSFIDGRVKKVMVNLGDKVRKGQTLMLIEGIEIGEIKAGFIRAKAEYDYADANLKRQKSLFEQKIGSQKSLLEAQAEYEKAFAGLDAEDKRIHSIGLSEQEMDSDEKNNHTSGILAVRTPIDGVVVERNVVIGEVVNSEKTAFKILNNSSLWVDGQIYEKDLPAVSGKPDIQLRVAAYNDELFKGKLQYIGEVVESESRTIKVRAEIQNTAGKLKPEMFGEMIIPLNKNVSGISVESEAIVRENDLFYVFVAMNDSTFSKRQVVLGHSNGERTEIVEGLKVGERIASKGTFFLRGELHKEELEGHEH